MGCCCCYSPALRSVTVCLNAARASSRYTLVATSTPLSVSRHILLCVGRRRAGVFESRPRRCGGFGTRLSCGWATGMEGSNGHRNQRAQVGRWCVPASEARPAQQSSSRRPPNESPRPRAGGTQGRSRRVGGSAVGGPRSTATSMTSLSTQVDRERSSGRIARRSAIVVTLLL